MSPALRRRVAQAALLIALGHPHSREDGALPALRVQLRQLPHNGAGVVVEVGADDVRGAAVAPQLRGPERLEQVAAPRPAAERVAHEAHPPAALVEELRRVVGHTVVDVQDEVHGRTASAHAFEEERGSAHVVPEADCALTPTAALPRPLVEGEGEGQRAAGQHVARGERGDGPRRPRVGEARLPGGRGLEAGAHWHPAVPLRCPRRVRALRWGTDDPPPAQGVPPVAHPESLRGRFTADRTDESAAPRTLR